MLSRKGHWNEVEAIKFFLDLLAIHDKEIKKLIFKHVIELVAKVDSAGRKSNIHKELTEHFALKIKDSNFTYVKNIFKLIVVIMKKGIWKDAKTVNLVGEGTYHDDATIVSICCRFFIENVDNDELDISSDEEADIKKTLKKGKSAKYELIHKKKTKSELTRMDRLKRKVRKINEGARSKENENYLMIELLYNPLTLCDKIFTKMKSSRLPFRVKIFMMGLVSRIIWRFELIFPNYFHYLHRYIKSNNNELPAVLSCLAGACHSRTPVSEIRPIV